MVMRGKLNYAEKVEREIEMIKEYESLLEKLEDAGSNTERPSTSYSKSFFVTTHKMEKGRETSHTARTSGI